MPDRLRLLRILLILGGLYYVAGAIVHFFGLTVFPIYDSGLYAPYHDTVIALVSLIFAILLFSVARDPRKNSDTLSVLIIGGILAVAASAFILVKIDFATLGAPAKRLQTIVEAVLMVFFITGLLLLKPKKK